MANDTKNVNWTLTVWMSYFFGSLGVDRFIMGKIGTGIVKLLTLGGFGIWSLIDLILIMSSYNFEGVDWDFPKSKKGHIIGISVLLLIGIIYTLFLLPIIFVTIAGGIPSI